jgi:hypothetical protein
MAAEEYRRRRYKGARANLRKAYTLEPFDTTVYSLDETTGVLAFRGPPMQGVDWQEPAAFLAACIERRVWGAAEKARGHWIDPELGLLVHERSVLHAVRNEFMPREERPPTVTVCVRFLPVKPSDAKQCAGLLGESAAGREFVHAVTPQVSERLGQLTQAYSAHADLRRRDKDLLEKGLTVTARDRVPSYMLSIDQVAHIADFDVLTTRRGPVANPHVGSFTCGGRVDVFPTILPDGRIRVYLRATRWRHVASHIAQMNLQPRGERVIMIEVPEIREEVAFVDFEIADGGAVLSGRVPAAGENDGDGLRGASWLWVLAEVRPGAFGG